MGERLDKLRASLEKEKERRIKINNRIESLERRIQEAEAAEVNEMVRSARVTPEQLAALLRQSATTTPTPAALSAVGATFNYEDAKKQTLAKIGRIYDEILNRFQAASAVLHHNYTNFGTFSRKGALQSGVV